MRRFLIFLISGGGVFLFAITEIYPEFGTPAIRTVFKVGGVVLFVGTWLYVAVERALGLAHGVKKAREVMTRAMKHNPEMMRQQRAVAARSPGKNFLWSLLFTAVAAGFFVFGLMIKQGFFSPVHRIIWLMLAGAFFLIGLFTAGNYLFLVVRGKK